MFEKKLIQHVFQGVPVQLSRTCLRGYCNLPHKLRHACCYETKGNLLPFTQVHSKGFGNLDTIKTDPTSVFSWLIVGQASYFFNPKL